MVLPRRGMYALEVREDGRIPCRLCPHECLIPPGSRGVCGVRENREGELIALNYGLVAAAAMDPVEKKPLYHFKPGTALFSVGAAGCNMSCAFCQNWELASPPTGKIPGSYLGPDECVKMLQEYDQGNCSGVAYTYSEPLMWYEYVMDTAPRVRDAGYSNVLVTNGYANAEPWSSILEWVDACNIDVKGFDAEFYRRYCGAELGTVRRNVEVAVAAGVHVEITLLVIPEGTDDPDHVAGLVRWLASMDRDIPLHISRYFPHHRMRRPATSLETLKRVQELAMQELNNVYLGNVSIPGGNDTSCKKCGNTLIERSGYRVRIVGMDELGKCAACGTQANVVL
ncbi:MAG: AmmeMemoRadiSam system radical SAM enzyme [Bacillota bacterium]